MPQVNSSQLTVNAEIAAAAPDTVLAIAIEPNAPLKVGGYVFRLVVEDDSGNEV